MTQDLASGPRESSVSTDSNGKGGDIPDLPPPAGPCKQQAPKPPPPPKAGPSAQAGDPASGTDDDGAESGAKVAKDSGRRHTEPEPMELDSLDIIGEMQGMLDKLDSLRQHCEATPEPVPETGPLTEGPPEAGPQEPPPSPEAGPQKPPPSPEAATQQPHPSPEDAPQKPPPLSEVAPQKPPLSPEVAPQKPPLSPEVGPQRPPLSPEVGPQMPPPLSLPHDQHQTIPGASTANQGQSILRYHILGFSNMALNSIYTISNIVVGGKRTYWSPDQSFFMYFQAEIQKWQISPRSGPSEQPGEPEVDLLDDALRGGQRGLAMQLEETAWREWADGVWRLVDLQIGFDMGDGQFAYTAPGAGPTYDSAPAAPGTPAPAWSSHGAPSRIPMTPQVGAPTVQQRIPQTPRDKLLQQAGLLPAAAAPGTPSGRRIPQTPMGVDNPGGAAGMVAASSSSIAAKMLSLPERFIPDHLKASPPQKKRRVNEEPTLVNFGKEPDKFPVWVGHFRETVTLGQILQFFSQCGPIVEKDKRRTQAILHFESIEDRDAAVALDGFKLAGEKVQVRAQQNFEPEPEPAETSWNTNWKGKADWQGQSDGGWNGRGDQSWSGGRQSGQEREAWKPKSWSTENEGTGKDWTDWKAPKTEVGGWMDQRVQSHGSGSHGAGWGQGEGKSMEIPREMIGIIIGSQGSTIKRLQEQSGAKMKLEKGDSSQPGTLTLSGYSSCVAEGERMVQEILDRGPPKKTSGRGWGGSGPDAASDSMEVPRDKARLIIGKGGEVIKRLQAQSGATIKLEGNKPDSPGPCLVRMSGPSDSISRARSLIQEIVGTSGYGYGKGSGEVVDADRRGSAVEVKPCKGKGKTLPTDYIEIPADMASVVTGAGGEVLTRLQRQTGAKITLEGGAAAGRPSRACRVCFSGSTDNISRAKALVQTMLGAEEELRVPADAGGARAGQAGAGAAPSPCWKLPSVAASRAATVAITPSGEDDEFERLCAQMASAPPDDNFDQLCAEVEAEVSANGMEGEFDCLSAAMPEGTLEDASMQPAEGDDDEFERLCAAAT